MWTPGYWSWSHHMLTMYTFHSGYWAFHVGYYGGVNYGNGYGGFGYSGGVWHGGLFAYNLEIVNVNSQYVRETFRDPGLVDRGYIERENHAGFNGGPAGVNYHISPEEQAVEHEKHWDPTAFQMQYETGIRNDQAYWYNTNHGQPAQVVYATPLFIDPAHEHQDYNEHRELYVQRGQPEHLDRPNPPEADARYRPGNNKVEQNPNGQREFHPESGDHPQGGNELEHNTNTPPPSTGDLHPNNPPSEAGNKPADKPADKKAAPKPAPKPKPDKDKKTN